MSEKPLAIRLLNALEHYYRENACLQLILAERHVPHWGEDLKKLMADERSAAGVRDLFAEVRSAANEQGDLEQAIQRLLQVVPASKDVN